MNSEILSLVDASSEAALELEELRQGLREGAPMLKEFFRLLREPTPAFAGNGVCMFSDVQMFYLKRSQPQRPTKTPTREDLKALVEKFLVDLEQGVAAKKPEKIEEAKTLCLALNRNLLSRKMDDIYSRKEKSDSRYIDHESKQ
jgi:hypothetical protein